MERAGCSISVSQFVAAVKRHRLALSICQSAECALQQMCWRLRHSLCSNASVRQELLGLCCHYYNYRTLTVGLNQIQTVYDPDHTSLVLYSQPSYYHALRTNEVYYEVY